MCVVAAMGLVVEAGHCLASPHVGFVIVSVSLIINTSIPVFNMGSRSLPYFSVTATELLYTSTGPAALGVDSFI